MPYAYVLKQILHIFLSISVPFVFTQLSACSECAIVKVRAAYPTRYHFLDNLRNIFRDCSFISFITLSSRAEKNSMRNRSRPESRKESRSARKESRIGSDLILILTIFPRLWPRLSSRFLVRNVTILLYCMVINSPRTGSSRDNTTVASWKLGASFEIFPSKKFFAN